jgi:hypothetical protein
VRVGNPHFCAGLAYKYHQYGPRVVSRHRRKGDQRQKDKNLKGHGLNAARHDERNHVRKRYPSPRKKQSVAEQKVTARIRQDSNLRRETLIDF